MIASELESLLDDVSRHLSARDAGASSVLSLGTTLDAIGDIRQRVELCGAFDSAQAPSEAERRVALECLIRIVHLGGAEFYSAQRTASLFAKILRHDR